MTDADDGFLSRWARRKAQVRSGIETPAEAPARTVATPDTAAQRPRTGVSAPAAAVAPPHAPTPAPAVEPAPLPTMEDVARLTRGSDFGSFVQPGIDPDVSNAAMKKLFSDPRYNVMDGLDTYIGDYNTPDPIPLAMLRQMNQSKFLGLFDDEDDADTKKTGADIETKAEAGREPSPERVPETGPETIAAADPTGTEAPSESANRSPSPEETGAPAAASESRSE